MTAPEIEYVIADGVIAGVAARAAAAVPGVLRLELGVLGLVGHLARSGMQRWTGQASVAAPGVRVHRSGGWLNIQVDVAISAGSRVDRVCAAVQHEVADAVAEQTGVPVDAVSVTVLDIEPGGS